MKQKKRKVMLFALAAATAVGCSACGSGSGKTKSALDAKKPTTITVWNYYNGDQLAAFDKLVSEFNSSVGVEKGIIIESVSQGSIDNLADFLLDAANGKVGAQDLPSLAAIYAETAYVLNEQDQLVDMNNYFTEEEMKAYVPEFIEEGRMIDGEKMLLFPVSKSTECFVANATDWKAFEDACGINIDSIKTYEDLTAAAEQYYEWTDSLTPEIPEDGKALYGRDSVANYIYIGNMQLGNKMFDVSSDTVKNIMDREDFKTLWDNYYIPYINGYFAASASYRSEDMKTGTILAMSSSTSGVSYVPIEVIDEEDVSHAIEIAITSPLYFKDGEQVAVQQGAGYAILKGTEAQQEASSEFLKWFTQSDRNLEFSVSSGYSPVTIDANAADKIKENFVESEDSAKDQNILNALLVSSDVYLNEKTYTSVPFDGSREIRDILSDALINAAQDDREAVLKAMAQGKTREDAVAPYSSEEYFDTWFDALSKQVDAVIG